MNEQQTILSRIGNWLRRGHQTDGGMPADGENGRSSHESSYGDSSMSDAPLRHSSLSTQVEPRTSFLRPWARRDQAMNNLQNGFNALTDLMGGIRENLERQSVRQDELLTYLSHLPQVLEAIPESTRVQGETLKAIHQQLSSQTLQQDKLSEILKNMSETGGESRETLEEVKERVDQMRQTDAAIADNLGNVGEAMRNVSQSSQASAAVLTQLRESLTTHDGQLEQLMRKQNARFTTMLSIAIFLSIAALLAVSVIGYLLLTK